MKKIALILLACLGTYISIAQSPTFAWAKKIESFSAAAMAVDVAGNSYIAGNYINSALNLGGGVMLPYTGPGPVSEFYVAKYNPIGDVIWAKRMLNVGGFNSDKSLDKILVDGAGNVYLAGMYSDGASIDNTTFPATAAIHYDYFLAKLSGTTGTVQWVKTAVITGVTMPAKFPNTIRFNKAGNICMTGLYDATISFDAGHVLTNATSSSKLDAFVTTYDINGNVLSAMKLGGEEVYNQNDYSYDEIIKLDKDDNIYRLITTSRKVIKYNTSGTPVMTKVLSFSGNAFVVTAMDVDRVGNIFIGSWIYGGDVTIEGTLVPKYGQGIYTDAVLMKLNTTGIMQWLKHYEYAISDAYTLVRTDDMGNVYGLGQHGDAGEGRTLLMKYANDGTLLWEKVIAPIPWTPGDPPAGVSGLNMMPVGGGNAMVVGYFRERIYFDANTQFRTATGVNEYKTFLAKYGVCNVAVPTISATPATALLCNGDSVKLTSTPAVKYVWSTGDTTRDIVVKTTGNYYVSAIADAECYATSLPMPITVVPALDTVVTLSGGVLTAHQSSASYQWVKCSPGGDNFVIINNANAQTYTPSSNGGYAVIISNGIGCADTSACHPVVVTGIDELTLNKTIAVYPNPANDVLHVATPSPIQSVTIINQLGQRIVVDNTQHINISTLVSGMYYVVVTTDATTSCMQFIKQ